MYSVYEHNQWISIYSVCTKIAVSHLVEGLSFYGKFAHLRWEKLVKAYERAARKTYKNDPLLKK